MEPFFKQHGPHLSVCVTVDGMIELELGGNVPSENIAGLKSWADDVREAMRRVSAHKDRVLTLIDISALSEFDDESMKVVKSLMDFNKNYATKTATFGGNLFSVMAQNVLTLTAHRDNIKAFTTREKALKWLLGSKAKSAALATASDKA